MPLTREALANLQGDTVELQYPSGTVIRGQLTHDGYGRSLGIRDADCIVRWIDSGPGITIQSRNAVLTVIGRKARPLYVNHPRLEVRCGDVVRDAEDDTDPRTWVSDGLSDNAWCELTSFDVWEREDLPVRLRLLVDGETGQVVP